MPSAVEPSATLIIDNCRTFYLNQPITLYTTVAEELTPFIATAVQLVLLQEADGNSPSQKSQFLRGCRLILSVSPEQYQQVMAQSLFHLKPEVQGPLHKADFLPDLPILLELGLQSHFFHFTEDIEANTYTDSGHLPTSLMTELLAILEGASDCAAKPEERASNCLEVLLGNRVASPENAEDNLISISTFIAPWLKTNSWLCRSVQQQQAHQTVGYTTLWAHIPPQQTTPMTASGVAVLDAIASLLPKTTDAIKAEVEQELPRLQEKLLQFAGEFRTPLEQVDWDTVTASAEAIGKLAPQPVSAIIKQFCDEGDWAYITLPHSSTLQVAFQGNSGQWPCLLQSDDESEQVACYSICPVAVTQEDHYGKVSEFLMRANDGLIIGNFELNFTTGEIRYKTSLDVEGDRLSPALIRQLIHLNVQTLDTYLPGIVDVLEGNSTPAEAIAAIEQPESDNIEQPDHKNSGFLSP